jgi:hypothetical protein
VNVSAQPGVVGEIPANVVGVFVNGDIVAVPVPVITVGKVKRGDAEVEAAKPETAGIASLQTPLVSTAKAAIEAAMLPWVVEPEARVVAPTLVSHPFTVVVDVRGLGMILTIAIRALVPFIVMVAVVVVPLVRVAVISRGPLARNVSATNVTVMVAVVVLVMLRESRQGKNQRRCKNSRE